MSITIVELMEKMSAAFIPIKALLGILTCIVTMVRIQ